MTSPKMKDSQEQGKFLKSTFLYIRTLQSLFQAEDTYI